MSYSVSVPPYKDGKQDTVTRETFAEEAITAVDAMLAATTFRSDLKQRITEQLNAGIAIVQNVLWGKVGPTVGESVIAGEKFVISFSGHVTDGTDSPDYMAINIGARR